MICEELEGCTLIQVGPWRRPSRADSDTIFGQGASAVFDSYYWYCAVPSTTVPSVRIRRARSLVQQRLYLCEHEWTFGAGDEPSSRPSHPRLYDNPHRVRVRADKAEIAKNGQRAQRDAAVPPAALIFEAYALVHAYSIGVYASGSHTNLNQKMGDVFEKPITTSLSGFFVTVLVFVQPLQVGRTVFRKAV